jgi:hypothetical protein
MTPRNAAVHANKIYALWDTLDYEARCANLRDFLSALDRLSPFMESEAQARKYSDFLYCATANYGPTGHKQRA